MDPVLAFIVAIAGWVLAALSLAWNVRQYFLTGARIRVKLGTRVFGSRLQAASVPAPRRLRRWLSMDTPSSRVPFGIVLLTVTIYNGRSPVTIDSITAKSGKAGISYADDETPLPYRLEPHSSVTWTMLLSEAEAQARLAKRNRFHVVVALGNGKTYRSRGSYNVNGPRPEPADRRWYKPDEELSAAEEARATLRSRLHSDTSRMPGQS
ncbi:hypothetical protein [Plantibacter cousiniae (nom. nud.)]|uniref:PH domain-containing protein n=1 Tax=Plantibacter cousiniae (nom. nud.) TaxID=199709 RepID=A0ABY1LJQ2_9MICO|nr:hypothetical protein [Plantibacter cousiniae]SKC50428.1 hypothetical protein SAMN06295973_1475 [Plantibacter cousiniae]